jgi:hypothetical protein
VFVTGSVELLTLSLGSAAETNYSRNELINVILSHGVKNIIIE